MELIANGQHPGGRNFQGYPGGNGAANAGDGNKGNDEGDGDGVLHLLGPQYGHCCMPSAQVRMQAPLSLPEALCSCGFAL